MANLAIKAGTKYKILLPYDLLKLNKKVDPTLP